MRLRLGLFLGSEISRALNLDREGLSLGNLLTGFSAFQNARVMCGVLQTPLDGLAHKLRMKDVVSSLMRNGNGVGAVIDYGTFLEVPVGSKDDVKV